MKFLKDNDKASVKEIDSKCKNKWSWKWCNETLSRDIPKVGPVTYKLSECIVKIDEPGIAYCKWCEEKVKYGANGKKHLLSHCNGRDHVKILISRKQNYSLGALFTGNNKPQTVAHKPIAALFKSVESKTIQGSGNIVNPEASSSSKPLIAMGDRTANMEAMILSFIAEKSLPLSLADPLVELMREGARDTKALNAVKLSKTTSSYKLKYGLSKSMNEEVVAKMKNTVFSLNVDEGTSDHGKKVLGILVSFFDDVSEN